MTDSLKDRSKRLFPSLTVILIFLVFIIHVHAQSTSPQSIPPANRKLTAITATGSQRFTAADISAASGLLIGSTVTEEDFRKAARNLGETGAFNDVAFSFSHSSAGIKLAFQVADADKFVPARFMDFVWFSHPDLLEKVHSRVPLFHGELPASGRMADQVSDVLQALLVERAIPGHVEYVRSEAKGGRLESFDYGVANVSIRIGSISFTGAPSEEVARLQSIAERLESRDYTQAAINDLINRTVLPALRGHGYLKATCTAEEPQVSKTAQADAPDEKREVTVVNITLSVTPGIQYKIAGWKWSGNQAFPTDALQPMIQAIPGQLASTVRLETDLREVQRRYGSRGYVTATIKADAEFDDTAQTVIFDLLVTEGAVFHMGELEFRGIDNGLAAKLRAAWKLHPGDIYDATYLQEFLPQAKQLLPATIDWEVDPHVTAVAANKTVDVDLVYTAKATQ